MTVLRDPVARVLSLFRYLADPESDRGHAFGAPPADRDMAVDGFDRFLDRISQTELLNQLYMFSQQLDCEEAAEHISRCSLVFFLDDMSGGMRLLSEVVGRPLPERAERRSSLRFQPTEAQLDRLREALAVEYALMDRVRPITGRRQRADASAAPRS